MRSFGDLSKRVADAIAARSAAAPAPTQRLRPFRIVQQRRTNSLRLKLECQSVRRTADELDGSAPFAINGMVGRYGVYNPAVGKRRIPFSLTTTPQESRYALISLLSLIGAGVVLIGVAWKLLKTAFDG